MRKAQDRGGRSHRQADAPSAAGCRMDILLRAVGKSKEKKMSYNDYFGALRTDQRRLAAHGLGPYPSDNEVVDYVMDVDDRVRALYKAFRVEAYRDYRGIWRVGPLGVNPVRYE